MLNYLLKYEFVDEKNMKLGILTEFNGKERHYIRSCEELNIDYKVIDFISSNWLDNVLNSECDGFLVRPAGDKEVWKRMYDEKLYLLVNILDKKIYPSLFEILLYENKKMQAYWLNINNIPHPKTWVFYIKSEALNFIDNYNSWPLVFKTNVGAVSLGVKIIKNKNEAKRLIKNVFTKFRFFNRGYTRWHKTKRGFYYPIMDDRQFNFILFQEFIDVKWEWRVLRVGDSYFGHQKLKMGEFHSGSGAVGWVRPPDNVLNFAKKVSEIGNFRSMSIDIFEDNAGNLFINELQTVMGGELVSQMFVDGKPYRLLYMKNKWELEAGVFNQNKSCNLKVMDFIKILENEDVK